MKLSPQPDLAFLQKLLQESAELSADKKAQAVSALQKALEDSESKEQQLAFYAKEAKLDLALERLRFKTMTMHTSEDVAETVSLMFDEMVKLGVNTLRSGIGIMRSDMTMEIWTSNIEAKETAEMVAGRFDLSKHPMLSGAYFSWKKQEGHYSYELRGDDLMAYYVAVNNMPEYHIKYNLETVPTLLFLNSFHFVEGNLFVFSLEQLSEETSRICKRFAAVFGQTYRRFLDLREAEAQRERVQEKNKEITDSINYAQRIQKVLLTSETYIKTYLPEFFLFFQPKDIVSGDFYWALSTPGTFLLATADCTGHGVPGAFMSMLGVNFLNEIVIERNITQPDLILNKLREEIIKALNPKGSEEETKDGMDCVLCAFDFEKLQLRYAAANNSFYIIRNGKILIQHADKMPVGKQHGSSEPFTLHTIQLQKGDTIYTFTDGYADQFGGEKGKKFLYKRFEELLLANAHLPMREQQKMLSSTINSWKKDYEQVDDMLVMGMRFPQ